LFEGQYIFLTGWRALWKPGISSGAFLIFTCVKKPTGGGLDPDLKVVYNDES
jgi:hypothetical protein